MKWLKDEEHAALKAKADNYDSIVNSIVAKNESLQAGDVTVDVIVQAIENESAPEVDEASATRVTELEGEVGTLTTEVEELTTERDALQTKVTALSKLPGAESINTVKPAAEATTVETDELLLFAKEHAGDTMAIAAKMREAGYGK
jgi:hypothetical protein